MDNESKKYVKKTGLSVFEINIQTDEEGSIVSGLITHRETGESYEFKDLYDMINHMQQKYDKLGYPQSGNKLRTWKD